MADSPNYERANSVDFALQLASLQAGNGGAAPKDAAALVASASTIYDFLTATEQASAPASPTT